MASVPEFDAEETATWQCRHCGCTDERACAGGCYWIEEDLCNRCEEEQKLEIRQLQRTRKTII